MSIGGKLGYGVVVMLIGLLVVFIMLTILIVFLKIMARFFTKKKAAPAPVEVKAPVAEPDPEPEPETEEVTDDEELIAVISAAIAAFSDANKPLVVRKVRRVSGWKNSARAEQIAKF